MPYVINAINDGTRDALPEIQKAIDTNLDCVLPTGIYKTTGPIHLRPGHSLIGDHNTSYEPVGDFDVIRFYDGALLRGGKIDSSKVQGFSHAHILVEGKALYGGEDVNEGGFISYMTLIGNLASPSGFGIQMVAREERGAIASMDVAHMKIRGFEKCISLQAIAKDAYVNGNNFTSIDLDNFVYGIHSDADLTKGWCQTSQNNFALGQIQGETPTKALIYCNAESNTFQFYGFDLKQPQKYIVLPKASRNNMIITDYDTIKNRVVNGVEKIWIIDEGVNNYFVGKLESDQKIDSLTVNNLTIFPLKAKTGQRYAVINTKGNFLSTTIAPKGT